MKHQRYGTVPYLKTLKALFFKEWTDFSNKQIQQYSTGSDFETFGENSIPITFPIKVNNYRTYWYRYVPYLKISRIFFCYHVQYTYVRMYVKHLTRAFHTCIERFYTPYVPYRRWSEIWNYESLIPRYRTRLKWKLPIFRMNPTVPVQSVMDGQIVRNILHFCSFLDAPYNHYGIVHKSKKSNYFFGRPD